MCRLNHTYILLSLAFIIVNLITLYNLAPWIDEVMFLDTSYNAAVHGSWETTAWYRVAGKYPFPTYPPLYQMVVTVWIWLFGGSLVAVRSLNLLVTFVLGFACLQLMKRHGQLLTAWPTTLFTLLLWGVSEMAWMYRNGRPDMLCALLFVICVLAIDKHLRFKSASSRMSVVAASALLLCSGIQVAACLCGLWLFLFIVMKGRRKDCLRLLALLIAGISLGLLLVALFMLAHDRLLAFACSILQYSATLSAIVLAVLPKAGQVLGFATESYTQKLLDLAPASGFGERLVSFMACRSFLFLFVVSFVAYVAIFRRNLNKLLRDKGFLVLLFSLYVPIFMTLMGRFAAYYRWMAFLPLLLAATSVAVRHRWWGAVLGVVALFTTAFGIRSLLPDEHACPDNRFCLLSRHYKNRHSFAGRQHFKPCDAVVCPFSLFYELKPVCDTCYFVGIFPIEFIGHVDYIIEAPDGNNFDQPITDYVNKLKADTTIVLKIIDHCEHPSLILYQVISKTKQKTTDI